MWKKLENQNTDTEPFLPPSDNAVERNQLPQKQASRRIYLVHGVLFTVNIILAAILVLRIFFTTSATNLHSTHDPYDCVFLPQKDLTMLPHVVLWPVALSTAPVSFRTTFPFWARRQRTRVCAFVLPLVSCMSACPYSLLCQPHICRQTRVSDPP